MPPYAPKYDTDRYNSKEQLILENFELRSQLAASEKQCESLSADLDALKCKNLMGNRDSLEAKLSNAIEMAHIGLWDYDVLNDLFTFNDQFYKILRTTADQVGGYTLSSAEYTRRFVHPDDIHIVSDEIRKAIETSDPRFSRQIDHRILYADGTVGYITVRFFIKKDAQGRTIKTYGVNQDISERNFVVGEISKKKEILQKIFDHLPVMISFVGEDGRIKMVNPKWQNTIGWSLEDTSRKDIFALCYPDPDYRGKVNEFISRSDGEWADFKLKTKDGKVIDTTWTNIQLSDGTSIGIGQDISDRKTTEEDLRESERLLSAILESIAAPVFYKNLKGVYLGCNKLFAEALGLSKEEIVGKTVFDVCLGDCAQQYHLADLKLLKTGQTQIYETEYTKANGSKLQAIVQKSPLRSSDGIIKGIVGAMLDIGLRKQAEQALSESERYLRTILQTTADGFCVIDLNGIITEINEASCRLSGYAREDLLGMHIGTLAILDESLEITERIERITRNGFDLFETRHRGKDGHVYDVEVSATYLESDGGKIVCFCRDINERKQAQMELQEKEKRFREMAEMLPEGIFEADTNMNFTFINQQAFKMFGYSEQDFETGLNGFDMIVPEERQRAIERFTERLRNRDFAINEYRGMRKDGSTFPVLLHLKPILNEETIMGFRGVAIDISEQKSIHKRLQKAQKMESIGNLAGGIAHDFNNILFPIIGLSELLMEDLPLDSPQHENACEIHIAGKRGSDLVKQILAFSRQSEYSLKLVRIQKIICEVLKLVRSTIPSNIEIEANIQKDCGLILADPTQIHQIAMNLITNAYHAVEQAGGKISIHLMETVLDADGMTDGALKPGKYAMLTISDNGCGIDPNVMDKIFDPYFTTKEQGKGTGLGLSVAYGIIKEYNGDIKFSSELGKGSSFKIYFPLMNKYSDDLPAMETSLLNRGNEHILIVDDEESIARLQKQILERLGYRVTIFISSIDALKAFRTNPHTYDLVITDMTMPNLTGDQLAKELISIKPDIPVIICTGFSESIDSKKAAAMGIKGFLMKPVVRSELTDLVREILD